MRSRAGRKRRKPRRKKRWRDKTHESEALRTQTDARNQNRAPRSLHRRWSDRGWLLVHLNVTTLPKASDWISPEEFLEGERLAEVRHEYVDVLVEQERMVATILRRTEPGWQSELLEGPGSIFKLPGLGVEIPLKQIYERTTVAGARASAG